MKEHRTINSVWASLVKAMFGDGPIPQIQHDEMKKAFYAGAVTVIDIMLGVSNDSVSEQTGADIFEGLLQECTEFARGMKK